jgi:pimeloyl-ACP methyl ester carboxylesterase
MWLDQREGLSARARVLTPDQRGFGGSPLADGEPSLDACADDLADLLDALGLGRVVLGGLSMGGYVAMAFLRRHPERVEALLLADTKARRRPRAGPANRLRIADELERDPSSTVLLDDVLPALLGEATTPPAGGRRPRPRPRAGGTRACGRLAQRAMAPAPTPSTCSGRRTCRRSSSWGTRTSCRPPRRAGHGRGPAAGPPRGACRRPVHLSSSRRPNAFNAALGELLDALG